MTVRLAVLSSVVCWAFLPQVCDAQYGSSMTQGRSGFGQTGSGQSGFGQGTGAFGAGGQGRGQSRGGFGNSGGIGGFGGGAGGLGQQAFGNNQIGGLGGNGFIGGDAAQMQDFFRAMNRGQRAGAMLDFAIENLNEMRDRGGQGNGQDRTPPVRVKLRPAFETPLGTMQRVSTEVQTRLTSSADDLGINGMRVTMEGRTATLEGKVASEHQRDLAEKMLSLEPGVSSIDNRLVVEAASEE